MFQKCALAFMALAVALRAQTPVVQTMLTAGITATQTNVAVGAALPFQPTLASLSGYVAGNSYSVGDLILYSNASTDLSNGSLYAALVAHTGAASFTADNPQVNWSLVGNAAGLQNWIGSTHYAAGQLAIQGSTVIKRIAAGTSRATYDGTESQFWTVLGNIQPPAVPVIGFVDSEQVLITGSAAAGGILTLSRAAGGTTGAVHAAGATVYLGTAAQFGALTPSGNCTIPGIQYVNTSLLQIYSCVGGTLVANASNQNLSFVPGIASPNGNNCSNTPTQAPAISWSGTIYTCQSGHYAAVTGSSSGTLTGLTAGTGLTGGGTSGNVPLALAPSAIGTIGGVQALAQTAHQWIDSINNAGLPHSSQPASTDLSDVASIVKLTTSQALTNKDLTDPSNVFPILNQNTSGNAHTADTASSTPSLCPTGQYPSGVLPNFNATGCQVAAVGTLTGVTANTGLTGGGTTGNVAVSLAPAGLSTIGGVQATSPVSHQWLAYCDTSGVCHSSQPNYSDLAGTNPAAAGAAAGLSALQPPSSGSGLATASAGNTATGIATPDVSYQSAIGFNPVTYGATHNALILTDGVMSASGTALSSTSYTFVSGDVNKTVIVANAGTPFIATPSAQTITQGGTGGSTSYSYQITSCLADGSCTASSGAGTTSSGNAALSGTNYNIVAVPLDHADHHNVYRVGSPTVFIGAVYNSTTAFNDIGQTGITAPPPVTSTIVIGNNLISTISSVSGGVATLANAATVSVTGSTVDFGTLDDGAFRAALAAAGNGGHIYVPAGNYLLDNRSVISVNNSNLSNVTWDFAPGAYIIGVSNTNAHTVFNITGTTNFLMRGFHQVMAGNPRLLKDSQSISAGGLGVKGNIHPVLLNTTIDGGSVGISSSNNISPVYRDTVVNNTSSNGIFSANDANFVIDGVQSSGGVGDAVVETSYYNVAGFTAGNIGGTINNVNATNAYSGLLVGGQQNVTATNINVTNTCVGGIGVVFDHSLPTFSPKEVHISTWTSVNSGQYITNPYFGSLCTNNGTIGTSGNGLSYGGGITSAYFQDGTITNSAAAPIQSDTNNSFGNSGYVSLNNIKALQSAGNIELHFTNLIEAYKVSGDTLTGGLLASNNGTVNWLGGSMHNVCTAITACSNRAYDFESNTNVTVAQVSWIDDQSTATGTKFFETGTTNVPQVTGLYPKITNGTAQINTNSAGATRVDISGNLLMPSVGTVQFMGGSTGQTPTAHMTNAGSFFSDTSTGGLGGSGSFWNALYAKQMISTVNSVASSATPAFNLALGTYQTNTLTANVTSSTATGLSAGLQSYFKLTENSTGGFSYVWPTNIKGAGPISTVANAINVVGTSCFDTSNCYATGPVMDQNGNASIAGYYKTTVSTVSALQTCNSAAEGARSGVTDALTPTSLVAVTGGGAVHVPVYCNGTNWIVE